MIGEKRPFFPLRRVLSLVLAGFICLGLEADLRGAPPALPDPEQLIYPPLSFQPPQAVRFTLANGIGVYFLEDRELPLVNLHALIQTGRKDDPEGQEGLAELTGQVMRSGGVEGLSGDALDEVLEEMAALVTQTGNRETTTFSLSLMSKDRERGTDLFSRILRQPSFEEGELALSKSLKNEELRRLADDPQALVFREFGRIMLEGSPGGRVATTVSLAALQREDLVRFHRRHVRPDRILLALSGDLDSREAERLLNRYFGSWPVEKTPPPPPPAPPHSREGALFLIPKEGPQSIVLLGSLAPVKGDPRSLSMGLVDFYTGSGGFRSRIVQEVRTDRGLAYSAGSFYQAGRSYGLFGAYAFTKSDSTQEVISLLKTILQNIAEKPISSEEMTRMKSALLNRFIFSFTSTEQIALQQLLLEIQGLPPDYLMTYPRRLADLELPDFTETARRFLDPSKAVVVVLGNEAVCKDLERIYPQAQRVKPVF
ncbi:MAG: insulinase family protein [Syntrophaceae bacterium]|nr:insulinase family protein [Syntrophaceae bacterium]